MCLIYGSVESNYNIHFNVNIGADNNSKGKQEKSFVYIKVMLITAVTSKL